MSQTDEEFLDCAVVFWQTRTSRRLTRGDARQMVENVTGFLRILAEWDCVAQRAEACEELVNTSGHGDDRAAY